ncbi:MAG: metallophosphoesterase family protein [Planctomycetota bacterium]|jgi:hypothetical protein
MPELTEQILRYVEDNPGCSGKQVARGVRCRKDRARDSLRDLAAGGLIENHGWEHCTKWHAAKANEFTVSDLPEDIDVDELVSRRKAQFAKKREFEEARRLIPVDVNIDGPVGILHMGDPHVDDDGTDVAALEHHTDLARETEGLFCATVGDVTNNWVGRLAKLWAQQSTSAAESWKLAEWLISRTAWLYIVSGNHDLWSGDGDPLNWIAGQAGALKQSSEVRLQLRHPCGETTTVNARHDHSGHSQYNAAHGPSKAAIFGTRDDILIAGHKHVSGYNVIKDPETGKVCHAIRVASYKAYDRFAREKGFRDQAISPCCLTVIDPAANPPTKALSS